MNAPDAVAPCTLPKSTGDGGACRVEPEGKMKTDLEYSDEPQSAMTKREWNGREPWTMIKRCVTGEKATMYHDDIKCTLVFFSTFGELNLSMKWPMEDSVVVKLYEPSPTPCLYVAPAENMVGRVPLIPLFLAGTDNSDYPPYNRF